MLKTKYRACLVITILMLFISSVYNNYACAMNSQKIKNTAPVASFTVQKSRNVRILVLSDYTGTAGVNLKNAISNMKSQLANDARISVEYANPSTITLGTQQGKYKENTWGKFGHTYYAWSGSTNEGTYTNKPENADFSYSPMVVLPEGKSPTLTYPVPMSFTYTVERKDGMFGGGKDRVYSFYSSSGLCTGRFPIWLEYSYAAGNGKISGTRSIDTEPEFTYDDFWSIYTSNDVNVTNTVTGWDLSKINYTITEGTDTYIVFAMNNEDTNYYHKSCTYSLGQLRSDANLSKYVAESNARVYSICSENFENVNLSTNPSYPVTFTTAKQNISLKDLISMSYDGRSIGKNNIRSLVKSISENIKKPAENIDMLIATDKSQEDTKNFISNVKNSVSEGVSLKASVVNKTETLYSWDKPKFSPGLRMMKKIITSNTNVYLFLSLTGELWGIQESYDSSSKYYGLNSNKFTKIADNVKDAFIDSLYKDLYILKNDGTVWLYSLYDSLKQLKSFANIKKIQVQIRHSSYEDRSIFIVALDNDGYLWHLGNSNFEGDMQDSIKAPTKMHFKGNGSIVDFSIPQDGYGGQGADYTITVARANNEVWEMHSGYVCAPDSINWVKAQDVYKGLYNNQQLSPSLWQSAVHTQTAEIPIAIDPDLRITDIIKLDKMTNSRYIGVDAKSQIYLISGGTGDNFNNTCSIINKDMDSMIQKETVQVKAFPKSSILKTTLTEGSDRYFIYISDSTGLDTSKSDYFPFSNLDTEIIRYLKENNFNIYVVTPTEVHNLMLQYPYAPETRQTNSLRDLLNLGNADSAFCRDMDDILKIIENRYSAYEKKGSTKLTLIANEDSISYNVAYSDFENDPRYQERWQYTHVDTYFDNPGGIAEYSGKWLTAPVNSFSKVGRYTVVTQFRDNPKDNDQFDNYRLWSNISPTVIVIVHRRPYARFNTQIAAKVGTTVKLSYQDQSYDLDHNVTREDKGIAAHSWQYKKASSATWINGRPESLPYNSGIYQIKLNVKDLEGAWSKAYIDILDTKDLPPSINADPASFNGFGKTEITITASDHGEDDFAYMRYAITGSAATPTETQWVKVANGIKQKQVTIDNEGTFYLHLEAYDVSGQSGKNTTGPYTIENLKAGHFYITMMLDPGWRSYYFDTNNGIDYNDDGEVDRYPRLANTDIGTVKMPINYFGFIAHPKTCIKAGYKVKGKIDIHGEPDWAGFIINYSLNKKAYTDSVTLTRTSGDTYTFEWIIPLETDNKTFISFNLATKKNGKTYGNEKWSDIWDIKNTSRLVFYVNGKATDDLIYIQSQ